MAMERKSLLNRRDALLAVGATGILAAFARQLRQATAAEPIAPKRLIVFWTPNGVVQPRFWPTGEGTGLSLSETLKALEPHRESLTFVKNVTYSGTGDHKTGQPFSTSGFVTDNAGISIDQEIANATAQQSLVLCGQSKNENRRGFISFDKTGAWVTPMRSPKAAYEAVFGPIGPGSGPTPGPAGRDPELETKLLDTVVHDIEDLKPRLPASELVKLEDHLSAILELKKKVGGSAIMPVSCEGLDGTVFDGEPDFQTRVKLHLDLMAACIACDARRIFSFMLAPAGGDATSFDFLGVSGGDFHNDIAHGSPGDAAKEEKMHLVDLWHVDRLAYLIQQLKSIPEGGGTAFDNTVILWTTECTAGNHGHTDIPVVLCGGAGGALKTGQVLASAKYENVLISLAHALGHPLTSFGLAGSGPISELLA
jgi:hypothetical protein